MVIVKMEEQDFFKTVDFLIPYEKFCVMLFSQVLNKAGWIYILKGNFGEIHGVFSWCGGRTINHCIPDIYGKNCREIEIAFVNFFSERSLNFLFCIAGEKAGSEFIKDILRKNFGCSPFFSIDNKLMENGRFDSKINHLRENNQLLVSPCKIEEIDSIFPMQFDYENEEVAIPGHKISPEACFANLENYVEAGAVYIGKIGKNCVCKASVTAVGKGYILLGGVFTVQKYRRHGLAKKLINFLWEKMEQENKKITLFVKSDNIPALRLYSSCGFKSFCDYEILYYGK